MFEKNLVSVERISVFEVIRNLVEHGRQYKVIEKFALFSLLSHLKYGGARQTI